MIERWVLVKLKPEFATAERRREVARHSRTELAAVPGVLDVVVGTPADANAERSWDLAIRVRLATLDDVGLYAADPAHRAFVDEYLKPRMEVLKAWNFEQLTPS